MNPTLGILLKVASTLVFTGMVVCIKAVSPQIPVGEAVFFRSFFALVPILVMLAMRGEVLAALETRNPVGHLWRGVVGVFAMGFWFAGLGLLPLPEALAIGYAAPLIQVVLAVVILGEVVRLYRWSAVAVGFLGIVVIVWPRLTVLDQGFADDLQTVGAACALTSAFFAALAMILVRRLVAFERTPAIVFYFSLTASACALLTIPFGWVWPSPWEATLLVLSGLLGGVGQILLTESYRHAEASTIAPFDYTTMIWGLAAGYVLFAEVPTVAVVIGTLVVVACGIFIIVREHRLGLERARTRDITTPAA